MSNRAAANDLVSAAMGFLLLTPGKITRLNWNDAALRLTHEGFPAWTVPDAAIVEIVKR